MSGIQVSPAVPDLAKYKDFPPFPANLLYISLSEWYSSCSLGLSSSYFGLGYTTCCVEMMVRAMREIEIVNDDSEIGVISEEDKTIYANSLVSLIQSVDLVHGLGLMRTYSNTESLYKARCG